MLVRVGGTRWLSHLREAIGIFLHGYTAFVQHLGQLQNRDCSTSRTERGNKAVYFYKAVKSKDVWLMLHFVLDVLVILSTVSQKFQEETCPVHDILSEINMAIKSLEKLKFREGLHLRSAVQQMPEDLTGNGASFQSAKVKFLSAIIDALNCRFVENPGILESCSTLSLSQFPTSEEDLEDYGDENIDRLVDHFRPALEDAGVDVAQISIEWTKLKYHLPKRVTKYTEL